MTKKTIFNLVVLIALLGILVVSANARLKTDTRIEQANVAKNVPVHDGMTGSELRPHADNRAPIGAAANPNIIASRGALIGQTYRDWQENSSIGRLVAGNPPVAGVTPGVHFVWMNATLPGDYGVAPASKMQQAYSFYDASTGSYPNPGGVTIQDASAGSTQRGDYPKICVYPKTGAAVVGGFDFENRSSGTWYYHLFWDLIPGSGAFGFMEVDGSTVPNALMDSMGVRSRWPRFAMSVTATDTVYYLAGVGNQGYEVKVYRKVGSAQAIGDPAWNLVYTNQSWFPTTDVACDPTTSRVAVTWTNNAPVGGLVDVYYAISNTGVAGSWTTVNLTNYVGAGYSAYLETCIMFDSGGKMHLMWPAGKSTDGNSFDDRGRIFHWSEWNPTKTYLVYTAEWDPASSPCGGLHSNVLNVGKVTFGECDGRLYSVFTSWNDPITGQNNDCQVDDVRANGENWVCISKNLEGISWDAPRNLSNSYTPGCAEGECNDDLYNSIALYGTDDAAFPGVENWGGAVTYDLGTGYTGTYFTQVFYHTDRTPGGAYIPQGGTALNDQRWIRLACVQPVTAARLDVNPSYIGFPEFIKPGASKNYTLDLTNIGNTLLTFTGCTQSEDSSQGPGPNPSGWLSFSGLPATINEAETKQMTLSFNAGGIGAGKVLYGHLTYNFTTPASSFVMPIRMVVTDTIAYTAFDTVSTACTDLALGSNGNIGQNAVGRANMDFFDSLGIKDCDTGGGSRGNSQIYIYDASPVIIKTTGATFRTSWSIYSDNFASTNGFKPMTGVGFAPHGSFSTTSYDGFNTGTFTTVDSMVRVEATYWAPKHADSCNFIVQRMRVFPSTIGTPVTGLKIGAYFDIDVPSDSGGSNNIAGTDNTRRMVWLRGFNSADTTVDCADNSRRYAAVALLNWHMKSKACFDSIYAAKAVNNTNMQGGGALDPDSMNAAMHVAGYAAEPTTVDQAVMMTYKDGATGYTLPANDTLTIYSAFTTLRTAGTTAAGLDSVKAAIDKAKNFMKKTVGACASCCVGVTGNVNTAGIVDLSDLSSLVSYLTGGGYVLPCPQEANVNNAGIVDLSDLSSLVSYLTGGGYVLPNCG